MKLLELLLLQLPGFTMCFTTSAAATVGDDTSGASYEQLCTLKVSVQHAYVSVGVLYMREISR